MVQSGGIITGISGIDNFINFPCKLMGLYWKELSNIDTKKINKKNSNNIFIDVGLNVVGFRKNWWLVKD